MEEKQEKLDFGQFETKTSNEEFLKMKDGESINVTFSKVEIITVVDEDKSGNPKTLADGKFKMKPQLKFTTETVNDVPSVKTWRTGNRNIVGMVKSLHEEKMFDKWVYKLTKNPPAGNSEFSNYTLVQLRLKA